MKRFLIALMAIFGLTLATPASAAFVFEEGDSYTFEMNGIVEGVVVDGLTSRLTLELYDIVGNNALFSYTLENTSEAPVTSSRNTAFGFNSNPDFASAHWLSGSVFDGITSGNVPGGLPNVEFCKTTGATCSGGGGDGVLMGQSTSGSFRLAYAVPISQVTLSDLYVRYQSVNVGGPYNIRGGSAVGEVNLGGGGGAIPEPSTWAMMILGFGAAGAVLRRQRRGRLDQAIA